VGGLKSQINGLPASGSSWSYDFYISVHGHVPTALNQFANTTTTSAAIEDMRDDSGGGRDSGGPGEPGKTYMIGKGAQPEMFVPSTSGQFVPNADKLFDTSGIVNAINSMPRPLTAKEITRAMVQALQQTGAV
jgi:hypothetical protein